MADMSPAAQAAADLVAGAARLVEAPPEGEQPTPETQETPAQPSLEADLSGLDDILEDDEEEPAEEPTAYPEPDPEDAYVDPDELRKRLAQAEKRNKWLEEQNLVKTRKELKAEIEQRFTLTDPNGKKFSLVDADEIANSVTSRRAGLKKAKAEHDKLSAKLAPFFGQVKQEQAAEQQAAREAEQQARADQWGQPSAGPQQPLIETAEETQAREQLDPRRHGSVRDMARARIFNDPRFDVFRVKGGR